MLTNTAIAKAAAKEKDYMLFDGDGLYLRISTKGKKKWLIRSFVGGRERKVVIGEYPVMSLQEARRERDDRKMKARTGVSIRNKTVTFGDVFARWLKKKAKAVSPDHYKIIKRRIEMYLLPYLANRPVVEISRPELLEVLQHPIKRGLIDTARRTGTLARSILDLAFDGGEIGLNVAADLSRSLPEWEVRNFKSAFDPREVRRLLLAIDRYPRQIVRYALRMVGYTFVRRSELRRATWAEIHEDEWHIPVVHAKKKRIQIVPLSRQALEILDAMRRIAQIRWKGQPFEDKPIFPSTRNTPSGSPYMGISAMEVALKWLVAHVPAPDTPPLIDLHGFRHMASTLLHEYHWDHEAIERQLSHLKRDKTEATYDKSKLLPLRRRMMQWWADYLDAVKEGRVDPEDVGMDDLGQYRES